MTQKFIYSSDGRKDEIMKLKFMDMTNKRKFTHSKVCTSQNEVYYCRYADTACASCNRENVRLRCYV